ncbi:ATP synthase subunit I [Paraglaciecola sp. 2405UD69-4]|uniref:ATP synthase subunit I n=1 Tax=Paraglaciecola sp. 2405UD69-4 TaxID=3391836 RepID=UPI0039C9807B
MVQKGRKLAKNILLLQSIIAIICTFLYAFFLGKNEGISALYGGLICIIPSAVFALLAFRYTGASKIKLVVRSFNKGNKLKFLVTIFLFVLVYRWQSLQPLPLIVTYVVTLVAQWPIIIFLNRVVR